jgi:hypothetical protein
MKLQADGDLEVAVGEVVTVRVTAVNTHYLAIFSDLQRADWTIVQPVRSVQPGQPGVQTQFEETRSFVANIPGAEAFALTLDFVRNQAGATASNAHYVIQVVGSAGAFAVTKQIRPIPPFPIGRPFLFEVV